MGTVVNALIFAPLPLVGAPWGAWSWAPLAALVAVFVALLCHNQLLHELADAAEDAPAGVHTTGARLGVGATAWLGVVLAALALALALPGQGPGLAVSAAVALLVSCLWLIRARGGDAATLRRSHRLLAVGCGALLMVVALLGSV
jgi:4-hydroxybenzoate polyprenyltransferase